MKLGNLIPLMFTFVLALPAGATVAVTSPINNTTVGTSVPVIATASTTCAKGVASTGVYVDNSLQYVANGNVVNKVISLAPGKHYVVVQEWDYCGGATTAPLNLTVPSTTTSAVTVTSPVNGATVSTTSAFVASATSSCAAGVSAMGVYVNNTLIYQGAGNTMNTSVTLPVGAQKAVVQEWDYCGGSTTTPVNVTVTGTTLKNIHLDAGWNQWGELPPTYDICDSPCNGGVNYSMAQNQGDITKSGKSTAFAVGGTTPYADVLFSDPVMGQGNKMGLTDANHTLMWGLHNFTLDTDVYVTNLKVTQDLEFDINMFGNGIGMEWGTECNVLDGGVWDYWDNVNAKWVHTSIPCQLNDNAWNHVTLQVQRLDNNQLLYQSVTVNGVVHPMNITVAPFTVPSGWWGMTVNFQLDGDYAMHGYKAYLDNTNFTYY